MQRTENSARVYASYASKLRSSSPKEPAGQLPLLVGGSAISTFTATNRSPLGIPGADLTVQRTVHLRIPALRPDALGAQTTVGTHCQVRPILRIAKTGGHAGAEQVRRDSGRGDVRLHQ
jgi:hypothetical protein